MRVEREILELLPCLSNTVAKFETDEGIDLVPVEMWARCEVSFDTSDECEDCIECDEDCMWSDDEPIIEILPMVVMNGDEEVSFCADFSNFIGLCRI